MTDQTPGPGCTDSEGQGHEVVPDIDFDNMDLPTVYPADMSGHQQSCHTHPSHSASLAVDFSGYRGLHLVSHCASLSAQSRHHCTPVLQGHLDAIAADIDFEPCFPAVADM